MAAQTDDELNLRKQAAEIWFAELRDRICATFEAIETEVPAARQQGLEAGQFERKVWQRDGGGGGVTCKAPFVSRRRSSTRHPGFAVYFATDSEKITAPSVAPTG